MPLGAPNLASTVRRFGIPTTRIELGPPTENADGFDVDGAPVVTTIIAHTFPAEGSRLLTTEDGLEYVDEIESHTEADLHEGSEATGQRPSRIVFRGQQYECTLVAPRATGPAGEFTWRVVKAVRVPPVELP